MSDFGDAPPITISELTGEQRVLRLTGRGLPYRPFTLKTVQRVEVEWLPGAPVGSATLIGPTEPPSQITGMWKQKYVVPLLGQDEFGRITSADGQNAAITVNNEAFFSVRAIAELVDDIVRKGQLLSFEWGDDLRHGFLASFEKRWFTVYDLEWTMEFNWISRGEDVGPLVLNTIADFDSLAAAARAELAALEDLEVPSEFGLTGGFLEGLQQFQQSLEDAIFTITDTVTNFTNKITSTVNAVRGIVSTFTGLEEDCLALLGFVENSFATAFGLDTGPGSGGSAGIILGFTYPEQTEAQKRGKQVFVIEVKQRLQAIRTFCIQYKGQMQLLLQGEIQETVTVQQGQSLQDIAAKVYGSPFEWRKLMAFNDLDGPEVEPGFIIFIPKASQTEGEQTCS